MSSETRIIHNNIDNCKIINFLSIADNVCIKSIKLDDNFIEEVNKYLNSYNGREEIYINLICNNITINTKSIFKVDANFIMPDNTNIITVIKCYKKNFYLSVNKYFGFKHLDEYYLLLNIIIENKLMSKKNIINSTYRELVAALNDKLYIAFKYLTDEFRDDYDTVLKVITQNPYMFKYASDRLKNNYNLAIKVVTEAPITFKYLGKRLQNNYKVATIAINGDPLTIKYTRCKMKDDYDMVLSTVKQHGSTLKYVSDRLKDNYDIVLAAVTSNKYTVRLSPIRTLTYASTRLSSNLELIKLATDNENTGVCYGRHPSSDDD